MKCAERLHRRSAGAPTDGAAERGGNIHPQRRGKNGNILFIRFTASATNAVVDELVRSITLRTIGSQSTAARTIAFNLHDGASLSSATMQVTMS